MPSLNDPRSIVQEFETNPIVPAGTGDRFSGYAVIGLPFRSGHVLALRRFPASSIGPAYTSVWHRDPHGTWTFYSNLAPDLGCARYFGGAVTGNILAGIEVEWSAPDRFTVLVGTALRWSVNLKQSLSTRIMNRAASLIRDDQWTEPSTLQAMGTAARIMLGTGRMNFTGKTPNGHEFIANPQKVWLIEDSHAFLYGADLGPTGPLTVQATLNDLRIPQRGLFATVRAYLKPQENSWAFKSMNGNQRRSI